jgi:hypothetical protein
LTAGHAPCRWTPLLLAAAVLLGYANALPAPFHFDDYNVIVDNPAVHGLAAWWSSMPGIRPLLKLSYASNWIADPAAAGFHAVNVVCHAASTLILYALLRRLAPAGSTPSTALLAAAVFALHPAQTEAVTYVAGRSISLMAVLYLGALLVYWTRQTTSGRLASAGLFALALATRETAWTLPFAIVLLNLAGRRAGNLRQALRGTAWHWVVLGGAVAAAAATPGYRRLLGASVETRTLKENLLTQIDAVWYLITRPLLGLHTNIDPDLPVRAALAPDLLLQGAVLVAMLAAGFWQLRHRPWLGFGILWFFLHLLPTNSVLPRLDAVNDRQLYLALIGPALVLAQLLWNVTGRRGTAAATAAFAIILGSATVLRNHDYRSEVALWQATAAASPGKARVWNNLGYAYALAGNRPAAAAAYERALALDPAHVKARYNLDALSRHD